MTRWCFNGLVLACLLAACLWLTFGNATVSSESVVAISDLETPRETAKDEELVFSTLAVDLGAIKGPTECRFEYRNRSAAIVSILESTASCSCTLSKPDKPLLGPGDSGYLTIAFDGKTEKPGAQTHLVRFNYLGLTRRQILLSIRFTNAPDILVPDRIELRSWAGHQEARLLTITDYRERPFDIMRVESTLANARATLMDKSTHYAPGWDFRIKVTADDSGQVGEEAGRLIIHTTDPERPRIEIALVVHRVQRIRVLPAQLRLATKSGERLLRGRLWLDDAEGKQIDIESVTTSDTSLTCEWERGGRVKHVLEVTSDGSPSAAGRPLKLRIRTKEPVACVLDVDVLLPS
jgi:hypothetical protein